MFREIPTTALLVYTISHILSVEVCKLGALMAPNKHEVDIYVLIKCCYFCYLHIHYHCCYVLGK